MEEKGNNKATIIVAIIGAAATVIAALIGIKAGQVQVNIDMNQQFSVEYSRGYAEGLALADEEYSKGYSSGYADGKSGKTQEQITTSAKYNSTSTPLSQLVLIDSKEYSRIDDLFTDSFGDIYDGALQFDASKNSYAVYNLKGTYNYLSGAVVATEKTGSGASMTILIYADDELVYSYTGLTKVTEKVSFVDIDVSNKSKLTIKTANTGEYSWGVFCLVESSVR